MAIIGTIRKHSGLAVALVGIAIAAFVLSDLFKAGPRNINNIGSIDGVEIPFTDFNYKVEENIEAQKINQEKENLSYSETFTIKQNTWQQYINEIIMNGEYEKLDLVVSGDELFDQLQGENPHHLIRQYFVNPETGRYDRNFVIQYIQHLDQLDPKAKNQWLSFEQFIKRDRLNQKYKNLISKCYYVPEAFAMMAYENQKKTAEFRYAFGKYIDIPDSLVTITEKDQKEYYEENKHNYEQEYTRDIDYVVFEIAPSQEDLEKIQNDVFQIFEEFKYTDNVPTFVNATSDNRYDSTWYEEGTLNVLIDSIMFNSEVGIFVEPYTQDNAWHMSKLVDIQYRPDSMKAEHVLISYIGAFRAPENINRTKTQARKLADSLYNVIRRNPFKLQELARELSNDGSVQENNGDLGWFADGSMIWAINNAVLTGNTGEIKFAETPIGYHIIKITDKLQPKKKVRVALIDRAIEPSSKTYQKVYVKTSKFAGDNNTMDKFEQAVIDQELDKREATYLREMSNSIPGLDYPRQIIRWAFSENTNIGDVSPVFDLDSRYVVATLTGERMKGVIPYDEMKEKLINNVKNELKGKYLVEKINSSGTDDIYQLAASLDMKVDTNNSLNFSARNIPGFGQEYTTIGKLFTLDKNIPSGPLKGNGAVFIILVDNFNEAPELGSYEAFKAGLISGIERSVTNDYPYRALEKKADIEDNRLFFY